MALERSASFFQLGWPSTDAMVEKQHRLNHRASMSRPSNLSSYDGDQGRTILRALACSLLNSHDAFYKLQQKAPTKKTVQKRDYFEKTLEALLAVLPENKLLGATENAVLLGLGLKLFLRSFACCMTDKCEGGLADCRPQLEGN